MHWTGRGRPLCIWLRVDGKLINAGPLTLQPDLPATIQSAAALGATTTRIRQDYGGIELDSTFCAPHLPDSLDHLSWPANLLSLRVRAVDSRAHAVQLLLGIGGEWAVDRAQDAIIWSRVQAPGMQVLRVGSHEQRILGHSGDDVIGDWGWIYLAAREEESCQAAIGTYRRVRDFFAKDGRLPDHDDLDCPCPARNMMLALAWDFGDVESTPRDVLATIALDELFTATYLDARLRPWWRRTRCDALDMLQVSLAQGPTWLTRCESFDAQLAAEAEALGGPDYAQLCAAAYRQCLAAHTLGADAAENPYSFSKENFSNGCIATLDVTYPSAPFFLLYAPEMLAAQLEPLFAYAALPRWPWPYAPHDLGKYPLANGQVYGGGELSEDRQMPVEECGNALILAAALGRAGHWGLAERHQHLLAQWVDYLARHGLDPAEQLCTDDFAGHLASNANLALKAIIAIGAWSRICAQLGRVDEAQQWHQHASDLARRWQEMADDGDHTVLAYGQPGTWSQKYNLVWDRLLGLDLFPPQVAAREIAYYLDHQNPYGLPLDSRSQWTKADWIVWSATLATDPDDFRSLIAPLARWLRESPDRVPFSDWYVTDTGRQQGFQARSVVGGVFIALLAERWRNEESAR